MCPVVFICLVLTWRLWEIAVEYTSHHTIFTKKYLLHVAEHYKFTMYLQFCATCVHSGRRSASNAR